MVSHVNYTTGSHNLALQQLHICQINTECSGLLSYIHISILLWFVCDLSSDQIHLAEILKHILVVSEKNNTYWNIGNIQAV